MSALAARLAGWYPDAERRGHIWRIALPIMGGMMSQNILNLVDIGMVGRLGDTALAATGIGSFTSYLAISFIIGLASGVQALAARRLGEGRDGETAVPLNGGLLLSLVLGIPIGLLLIALTPRVYPFLTSDDAVTAMGIPYLQVRLLSVVAVGMNFSFRGYWSAVHLTGIYLRTIVFMHVCNIFLNWVLIFGNLGAPEMGVFGAGLATTISLYIGTLIYFWFGLRHARQSGFLQAMPSIQTLRQQMRVSLPASLQQLFFSAGLVMLVWIVGRIGTAELAAVNVLMTFHITAMLPALGIGLAAATLVGNALGRGDPDDAERWGWNASALTLIYGIVLTAVLIPLAEPILGVFLTDPATRKLAWLPMVLWATVLAFDSVGMILQNALIGAGDTRRSMWITVIAQWVFFLPAAFLVGPVLGFGLLGVWIVNGFYRLGQALVSARQWQSRRWIGIEL